MQLRSEQRTVFTEADFDGSNAAPLLIVGPEQRQDLIDQQNKLAKNFKGAAYEYLRGLTDEEVINFVANSICNRMHQREAQNGMAYFSRISKTPDLSRVPYATEEEVLEACEQSKIGQARIAQHALSAAAWGMYSWEGKNITVIDTFRKDLEAPMWEEVSEFAGVDASPTFDTMRGFKVHQFIGGETHNSPIRAMRIEMKRTIRELEDGTELKARTFAVINTERSSGFSQRDIRSIFEARRAGESMENHTPLLDMIERLVDDTLPRGVALARNETVYGYNASTEQEFIKKRAEDAARADALL